MTIRQKILLGRRATAALIIATAGFGAILGAPGRSEPSETSTSTSRDLDAIRAYGFDLVPYATVTRRDGSSRRMLIPRSDLSGLGRGGTIPEGTRIFMESSYSAGQVGTVFHMRRTGQSWEFGSFSPERPDLGTSARASCLSCHAGAADTELVYTLPSLRKVAKGGSPSVIHCDRTGRTPCPAVVYAIDDGA